MTGASGRTSPSAIGPSAACSISATVLAACGTPLSPARIQEALNALQISSLLYETNGPRTFGLPSRATQDARTIYRTLGLTWNTAPFPYTPPQKPHRITHMPRRQTQTTT